MNPRTPLPIGHSKFVFIVFFVLVLSTSSKAATENQAIDILRAVIKQSGSTLTSLPASCLNYAIEGKKKNIVSVALRENHTAKCGGDPATSPVVQRFKVDIKTKQIFIYDVIENSYKKFDPTKP
jgi:hypothetical protein